MTQHLRIVSALALGWLVMAPAPALAIWINLSEAQRKEAMAYGVEHREKLLPEFNREWQVSGQEWVALLRTEFNALAYLARIMAKRNQDPPAELVERIIEQSRGGLDFAVMVSSQEKEYGEKVEVVLLFGEQRISPRETQVIRVPLKRPNDGLFEAHVRYKFPLEGINLQGQVTLVVKGPDGREERFPFDLSKVR